MILYNVFYAIYNASNITFVLSIVQFYINMLCFTGIIYDVIVEPPSVGSTTDEHGHTRPVRLLSREFPFLSDSLL